MIGQGARSPLLFAAYALMAMEVWRGVWVVVETGSWWHSPVFGLGGSFVVLALVLAIVAGGNAAPLGVIAGLVAVWTAVGSVAWIFDDVWGDGQSGYALLVLATSVLTAVLMAVLAVLAGRPTVPEEAEHP